MAEPRTPKPARSGAAVVRTRRLILQPMSCELMRAIIAADWAAAGALLGTAFPNEWRQDGWNWLGPRVTEGEQDPSLCVWGTRLARAIDANGSGRGGVIAEVGFHGPPDRSGWVEIGYRVVEACRRRGFAEEAVTGLLEWASRRAVIGVKASTRPGNIESATLLRKLGFAESGSYRHEELGEQVIFRRGLDQLLW
jgi:[ribosomal protein S5]-alanine N-acetyltransferase